MNPAPHLDPAQRLRVLERAAELDDDALGDLAKDVRAELKAIRADHARLERQGRIDAGIDRLTTKIGAKDRQHATESAPVSHTLPEAPTSPEDVAVLALGPGTVLGSVQRDGREHTYTLAGLIGFVHQSVADALIPKIQRREYSQTGRHCTFASRPGVDARDLGAILEASGLLEASHLGEWVADAAANATDESIVAAWWRTARSGNSHRDAVIVDELERAAKRNARISNPDSTVPWAPPWTTNADAPASEAAE